MRTPLNGFGFAELDCFLIHGSSIDVSDELTPTTNPIQLLDRLSQIEANQLFCGRSGLAFEYKDLKSNDLDRDFRHQTFPDNIPIWGDIQKLSRYHATSG